MVVLNRNGRAHLETCLRSVLALDGLTGPESVLVADDGSTDDSLALVRERFAGVRTLGWPENVGFAEGNNRAVAAVETDFALLLNNDTAVAPDALGRLLAAAEGGAAAAGARLVSWDGRRLDFDGGGASFTGHGHPLGHGGTVPSPGGARPTLFCSGAAMLVRRDVFLGVGGFDPAFFAYYEDVDLGWRLRLIGREVLHVPKAVARHVGGGSAHQLGEGRRYRLHERNALATVVKCYDDRHLSRSLPAALALGACRAGASLSVIDEADPNGAWPPLPGPDWRGWPALEPLQLDWPALWRARDATQRDRRVQDAEVIERMATPLAPVPPTSDGWAATRRAVDRFGLEAVFGPMPRPGPAAAFRHGVAVARRRVRGTSRRGGGG